MELNDIDLIKQRDPGKMLEAINGLPEQFEQAWEIAQKAEIKGDFSGVDKVVVAGMGGSAIGGDIFRVYAAQRLKLPVMVNREYNLPNYVGPDTLVFVSSYSGNTEETISAYQQAVQRGAKIIAITSGGTLGQMAGQTGYSVVGIPGGLSPRAATAFLFLPLLVVMARIGLLTDIQPEYEELVAALKTLRAGYNSESPVENNKAKRLARVLHNKIPVIYGVSGTTEVAAARWKGQINENAKHAAYWNCFPEMNHNEIVGFEYPDKVLRDLVIIMLRDEGDHPRIKRRMEITKGILQDKVSEIIEVEPSGTGPLTRIFSLTYLSDYTSFYLALLNGVNPTPVKMIDFLKNSLADE